MGTGMGCLVSSSFAGKFNKESQSVASEGLRYIGRRASITFGEQSTEVN